MHLTAADITVEQGSRKLLELLDVDSELGSQHDKVVVLEVDDIRAGELLDDAGRESADALSRRERVYELGCFPSGPTEASGGRIVEREDGERRAAEVFYCLGVVWDREHRRQPPGLQLPCDAVRMQRTVAGEVAVAHDQDSANGLSSLRMRL
jgi:hypothetical protein